MSERQLEKERLRQYLSTQTVPMKWYNFLKAITVFWIIFMPIEFISDFMLLNEDLHNYGLKMADVIPVPILTIIFLEPAVFLILIVLFRKTLTDYSPDSAKICLVCVIFRIVVNFSYFFLGFLELVEIFDGIGITFMAMFIPTYFYLRKRRALLESATLARRGLLELNCQGAYFSDMYF